MDKDYTEDDLLSVINVAKKYQKLNDKLKKQEEAFGLISVRKIIDNKLSIKLQEFQEFQEAEKRAYIDSIRVYIDNMSEYIDNMSEYFYNLCEYKRYEQINNFYQINNNEGDVNNNEV